MSYPSRMQSAIPPVCVWPHAEESQDNKGMGREAKMVTNQELQWALVDRAQVFGETVAKSMLELADVKEVTSEAPNAKSSLEEIDVNLHLTRKGC